VQHVSGSFKAHSGVLLTLDVNFNLLGELHASPPRFTSATARSAGRLTFA
jgi:hypothetical protein